MLRRLALPLLVSLSLAACAGEEFTPASSAASGGAPSGGAAGSGAAGSGGAAGASGGGGGSAGSGGSGGLPSGGAGGLGGTTSGGAGGVSSGGSGGAGGAGGTGGKGGTSGSGGSGGATSSCPAGGIGTFKDAFAAQLSTTAWSPYYLSKGTVGTSSGALHAKPAMDAGHYVGIVSTSSFTLDGCALWVEVPQVLPASLNGETYLMAMVDGSKDAEITAAPDGASPSGLKLVFGVEEGGSEDNQSIPYDPAAHRWWRLRFPTGKVGFDTSADGKTWVEHRVATRPSGMSNAFVELGAGTFSGNNTQPDAVFDNLNLPPP